MYLLYSLSVVKAILFGCLLQQLSIVCHDDVFLPRDLLTHTNHSGPICQGSFLSSCVFLKFLLEWLHHHHSHGFCFSSPQPIFMWLLTFSLTSHSGFLKISLLIFLTYFFSPHTPPVSFCQGSSTSVFLPFSLFLSWPTASPDQSTSTVTIIIIIIATTTAMTSLTEYL